MKRAVKIIEHDKAFRIAFILLLAALIVLLVHEWSLHPAEGARASWPSAFSFGDLKTHSFERAINWWRA